LGGEVEDQETRHLQVGPSARIFSGSGGRRTSRGLSPARVTPTRAKIPKTAFEFTPLMSATRNPPIAESTFATAPEKWIKKIHKYLLVNYKR
jgi:hypothetical protein